MDQVMLSLYLCTLQCCTEQMFQIVHTALVCEKRSLQIVLMAKVCDFSTNQIVLMVLVFSTQPNIRNFVKTWLSSDKKQHNPNTVG